MKHSASLNSVCFNLKYYSKTEIKQSRVQQQELLSFHRHTIMSEMSFFWEQYNMQLQYAVKSIWKLKINLCLCKDSH